MPFGSLAPSPRFVRSLRRALSLPVAVFGACTLPIALVGCGTPVTRTSVPIATPVTSGTRLLLDSEVIAANAFTNGIDTIAPDGSNLQRVINDDSAVFPRFSADGNKLVYEAGSGISFLVIANADGSNVSTAQSSGVASYPAFRPDGKALVFVSGSDELYTQNVDGSQFHKILTPPTGYGLSRPVYTPDGTHIVYEQDPNTATNDTPKVYVINADGSNRRALGPDYSITPAVSPDGKRIAYGGYNNTGTIRGLFLMNTDGTGQPTTLILNNASNPVFSPDGTKIAYLKRLDDSMAINFSPTYEIHIIKVDGTGDTRVGTKLAVATTSLDWR